MQKSKLWGWIVFAGSFAGLGFLSLYLSGKIQAFDGKGHVAKLCIVILPLLFAALVGISRVDDYWHHWQDVFAGGLLGLFSLSTQKGQNIFPLNIIQNLYHCLKSQVLWSLQSVISNFSRHHITPKVKTNCGFHLRFAEKKYLLYELIDKGLIFF